MSCKNVSICNVNKINTLTKLAYLEDFTDYAISRKTNSCYLQCLKEALRTLEVAAEKAKADC